MNGAGSRTGPVPGSDDAALAASRLGGGVYARISSTADP
jgi:hypothetical protein